eukprot:scaffold4998_cov72-Phaeocystis_antarctica.AAC.4
MSHRWQRSSLRTRRQPVSARDACVYQGCAPRSVTLPPVGRRECLPQLVTHCLSSSSLPLGGRAARASAGGEARWSPSNRPATASTPLRPPRPPPPAVLGCGASGPPRAARARQPRAAVALGSRSTAVRPAPLARCAAAGPAAGSTDWEACLAAVRRVERQSSGPSREKFAKGVKSGPIASAEIR